MWNRLAGGEYFSALAVHEVEPAPNLLHPKFNGHVETSVQWVDAGRVSHERFISCARTTSSDWNKTTHLFHSFKSFRKLQSPGSLRDSTNIKVNAFFAFDGLLKRKINLKKLCLDINFFCYKASRLVTSFWWHDRPKLWKVL